jgi:general secretion pathway protein D
MVPAEAIVRVDSVRNILVMRGTRAEAEGWMDIVRTFDVNLLRGMSVGVFPLKHSSVEEVQAALQLLAGGTGTEGAAGAPGSPGAAAAARAQAQARPNNPRQTQAPGAAAPTAGIAESNPLFGAVRILPIERINAIMVVTPRSAYLDEIRYWIEQFDRPNLNSAEPQLFVYKVRNGSADHLAELLNGIYGGTNAFGPSGATGVAPGLGGAVGGVGNRSGIGSTNNLSRYSSNQGNARSTLGGSSNSRLGSGFGSSMAGGRLGGSAGNQMAQGGAGAMGGNVATVALSDTVRVMADYINNTLLIHAKPAEYARIETTLKRLDVPRAQVLIEASIVEVSLTDNMSFGARWNFSGAGIGRYGGSGTVGAGARPLSADSAGAGFTYMLRNASNPIAVLEANSNNNNIRYLSNPSLLVLDNHTAAISVGDQIPVQTSDYYGSANNNYLTTNYEFKDTGVILNITPQVNAGNLVTMEIDQEVTDVGEDRQVGNTEAPTFRQRTMSSKVAVRSGETLVLGGLVKQRDSTKKEGLPFLSSIPLVGGLFGAQSKGGERSELLLVVTPRVIRSDDEAREVSQELRDRMKGISDSGWPVLGDSPKVSPAFPRPHISTPEEGQQK